MSVGLASEGHASTPKTSSPVLLLSSTDLVGICGPGMHVVGMWTRHACDVHTHGAHGVRVVCLYAAGGRTDQPASVEAATG